VRSPAAAMLISALAALPAAAAPVADSCRACHGNVDEVGEDLAAPASAFVADVHAEVGLGCADCHGGNPDPSLAGQPEAAMNPEFGPRPFVGVPRRAEIPSFCGRCHSDPDFMKRFRPALRVDQEREYWTSRHGQALRRGDDRVATCVDCHGAHGIVRVADTKSPVHATHVAETCRACHGSAERMAGYRRDDGTPLPVDQYALWRQSVHAAALLEKGDLSAPTCNDCHGNHGAVPPGVDSIAMVCGQCHGREAELFQASAKRWLFADHNEMLASAGPDRCASCHEPPDAPARLTGVRSFADCITCHGPHAVLRPTVAMLAPLPATPCAFCHQPTGSLGESYPERPSHGRNFAKTRDALLEDAPPGLAADERFDWLVDRALTLPNHTELGENGQRRLRPEFSRLFTKFRIGKRHFTYTDPATGEPRIARVRSCADCHSASPSTGEPVGLRTAESLLSEMAKLTARTASAERVVLAAKRGGVETRDAAAAIDQAVDAQIELEALVHSFSAAEDGAFASKQREGLEQAGIAYQKGHEALAELAYRRRGLAVFLVLVVLALVALALQIRSLGPPRG